MNNYAEDTDPEFQSFYLKMIETLTPEERFMKMNQLCLFGKLAMLEGLRERHPNGTENELKIMLAKNLHGDKFAEHISKKLNEKANHDLG
jgi:hypothetical protein